MPFCIDERSGVRVYSIIRFFLFCLPAEWSHDFSIWLLKKVKIKKNNKINKNATPVSIMGLNFPNKIGLAAGLDKNGECIPAWENMGFGFIEVGTVTPLAQPGNPKPRLFRCVQDKAIINRMGFNNKGVDYLIENMKKYRENRGNKAKSDQYAHIIGINIGKNKITSNERAVEDYLLCLDKVYNYADYIAINLSSPNTPGLRDLQESQALAALLSSLKTRQAELTSTYQKKVPLVVKLSPDIDAMALKEIARVLLDLDIEGVIATNTTLWRPDRFTMFYNEAGGLSGKPLFERGLQTVSQLSEYLAGKIPIIAVGGIDSSEAAAQYFQRGASLVQVYTGFIYQGPQLIQAMLV